MDSQEFETFADNYTSKDFERISFKWEGGYGAEFKDKNCAFRIQLCEFLIPRLNKTKLELIRDLYLEEGKTSEYTLGCYTKFHLLGQELLERGGITYLTVYLNGAKHTMDTALSSSKISLSKERARELLAYFDVKMKNPENTEEAKLYSSYFRNRFEREATK